MYGNFTHVIRRVVLYIEEENLCISNISNVILFHFDFFYFLFAKMIAGNLIISNRFHNILKTYEQYDSNKVYILFITSFTIIV